MRASLRSDWLRRLLFVAAILVTAHSTGRAEKLLLIVGNVEFPAPFPRKYNASPKHSTYWDSHWNATRKPGSGVPRLRNGGEQAIRTIQSILDSHCLIGIEINAESRVKSIAGPRPAEIAQNGWSVFLVKVHNEAGVTAELVAESPNARPVYRQSSNSPEPKKSIRPADIVQRWADVTMFNDRPLRPSLSGLSLEYRIVQTICREPPVKLLCGEDQLQRRSGNSRPGFSERGRHSLRLQPRCKRRPRYSGRRWSADHGVVHLSRQIGAYLSVDQPPTRAGFFLSSTGLSSERRVGRAAAWNLSGRIYTRTGI